MATVNQIRESNEVKSSIGIRAPLLLLLAILLKHRGVSSNNVAGSGQCYRVFTRVS